MMMMTMMMMMIMMMMMFGGVVQVMCVFVSGRDVGRSLGYNGMSEIGSGMFAGLGQLQYLFGECV